MEIMEVAVLEIKETISVGRMATLFKKLICCLVGHDFEFGSIFLPKKAIFTGEIWCARCGRDFTEDVRKETPPISRK